MPINCLSDLIIGKAYTKVTDDDFNFLDYSGRKLYWNQGYKGQNVIVAVLDTGVNANHVELQGQVLQGRNFALMYARDSENDTSDKHRHGTHVAATIAGKLRCGIAPMAKILPVKVLYDDGSLWDAQWLIDGLEYVYNWRGANGEKVDIVNMSLGGRGFNVAELMYIQNAIQKLNSIGIPVIVASGNTGKEETKIYPACFEEVITVGAVDIKKQIAYFSTTGNQVDLCQIGVDVLSADAKNNTGYIIMSGTSMATPIVSGIAALMISKDKFLNGEYNKMLSGDALEISYYKQLKNMSIDLGIKGTDKVYGAGFCTLNQREPTIIQCWLNSNKILVNGKEVIMDTNVVLSPEGRTMIPLRYFAEAFSATVTYVSKTDPITVEI